MEGTKARELYEQVRTFRENHREPAVTNVIFHVGTNHLPKDHFSDIITKISKVTNIRIVFLLPPVTFNSTPGLCRKSQNEQRAFLERYDPYE